MADGIPILFINEPIFLSQGKIQISGIISSTHAGLMTNIANCLIHLVRKIVGLCLDEWNLVSPGEFTNSAIHMSPRGSQQLASEIEDAILSLRSPDSYANVLLIFFLGTDLSIIFYW